jgi:hypothetical protein
MISIQRLSYIPEVTLRSLVFVLTPGQQRHLEEATAITFIVRRGEEVICMFGLANEVLLSSYYGFWCGLVRGQRLTLPELRMINPILDCISGYYHVTLRAAVTRGNRLHNAFAKFCRFTPFGQSIDFINYERGLS